MMADSDRGLSALVHAPAPPSSSARWYRFDIDCAAHPSGVSVRNLMREADGPRRKVKNSASGAVNGTTTGGGPAATVASNRPVAPDASSTSVAAAAASGTPQEGVEASGSSTSVKAGSGSEIGNGPSLPDSSGDVVGTGGTAAAQDADDCHDDAEGALGSTQAAQADSTSTEPSAGGPQHRASNWMSVIERLELEYGGGGGGFGGNDSVSGSGSDDSEGEDGEDRGGSGGEGGDGGGGKKKAKAKKKHVRKHSFDYEDDFIDDSELEKQYYAKEASSKVQTVHSGFFANQGAVATVEPDGGKEGTGASGGGDVGGTGDGELNIRKKKKPKTSSTSNEAGEGTTTTGASKKRKPPPQSSEAAGASASAAGTAGVGGAKKHPKLSEQQQQQQQQTANADHSAGAGTMTGEINGSSQQVLREVGSSAAVVNGAVRGSSSAAAGTATSGAKVMTAGASGALSGANGSSVVIGRESDGTSPRQVGTGGAVTPGNSEARGNDASATDAGASGTAGAGGTAAAGGSVENSGKTGPGEKGGKNGVKPSSPTWDTKLETAMVKFEEDTKAWVAGGRAAGEEAERVVEEIRALDVFARRTLPDVHNSRTYLVRLSAVYGKPPLEMKTKLIELKEQGDREECARLQKEFNALKMVFVSEVAACVGQLKASGQSLTPPFTWSDGLRGHLHDLLKAFEAWSLKEHGGPRTRQALSETKALYDQLAQEWPAELSMTADCLKKMFNNEKRRIKAKANKEAAAEAGTALPPTTAGTVTPTGVSGVSSTDMPSTSSPSSSSQSPTTAAAAAPAVTAAVAVQTPSANQSVPGGGGVLAVTTAVNIGNAGFFAGGPARQQQQGLSMPPPPALQRLQQAPATPVVPPQSSLPKETPASMAAASGMSSPAPSPPAQWALPSVPAEGTAATGTANGTGSSLSYTEGSTVSLSQALSVELMPPRGRRFDMPPSFDPRNFEEEIDDDEVAVME